MLHQSNPPKHRLAHLVEVELQNAFLLMNLLVLLL
jgi:hypothetical protein